MARRGMKIIMIDLADLTPKKVEKFLKVIIEYFLAITAKLQKKPELDGEKKQLIKRIEQFAEQAKEGKMPLTPEIDKLKKVLANLKEKEKTSATSAEQLSGYSEIASLLKKSLEIFMQLKADKKLLPFPSQKCPKKPQSKVRKAELTYMEKVILALGHLNDQGTSEANNAEIAHQLVVLGYFTDEKREKDRLLGNICTMFHKDKISTSSIGRKGKKGKYSYFLTENGKAVYAKMMKKA